MAGEAAAGLAGGEAGNEIRSPVPGGLPSAAVLTLLAVPAPYLRCGAELPRRRALDAAPAA